MSSITKQALEHALKSLLLKKPFHKITINDIPRSAVSAA